MKTPTVKQTLPSLPPSLPSLRDKIRALVMVRVVFLRPTHNGPVQDVVGSTITALALAWDRGEKEK